jgi:hypothetical protein
MPCFKLGQSRLKKSALQPIRFGDEELSLCSKPHFQTHESTRRCMVMSSEGIKQTRGQRIEASLLRHKGTIIACLWAAMAVGLAISLWFTGRNLPLAVALASTVMALILAAAGMFPKKDVHLGLITLLGMGITVGAFYWGFDDLVHPNAHTITIQGVESGYSVNRTDCDFSAKDSFTCKVN